MKLSWETYARKDGVIGNYAELADHAVFRHAPTW
jgi:hypothetical protein